VPKNRLLDGSTLNPSPDAWSACGGRAPHGSRGAAFARVTRIRAPPFSRGCSSASATSSARTDWCLGLLWLLDYFSIWIFSKAEIPLLAQHLTAGVEPPSAERHKDRPYAAARLYRTAGMLLKPAFPRCAPLDIVRGLLSGT